MGLLPTTGVVKPKAPTIGYKVAQTVVAKPKSNLSGVMGAMDMMKSLSSQDVNEDGEYEGQHRSPKGDSSGRISSSWGEFGVSSPSSASEPNTDAEDVAAAEKISSRSSRSRVSFSERVESAAAYEPTESVSVLEPSSYLPQTQSDAAAHLLLD